MIVYLKNNNGFIYGYAEFEIVNEYGQFKNLGKYLYIQEIWIHGNYRMTDAINKLIKLIDENKFADNCQYVYWLREKYNERKTRCLSRKRLAKMGV